MTPPLQAMLDRRQIVLLDGAVGTELERRGVHTRLPLWSALGLIEAPDVVRAIHADYISAGCDAVIANTFRTTTRTFAKAGLGADEAAALDRRAVELARAAATGAGREVLVAGSIAPLEDCYSPWLAPPFAVAIEEHGEQANRLAVAGVDFLMVETMPLIDEAEAAALAALQTGREVTVGFVLGEDGRLLSGESLAGAVERLSRHPIAAILVNCAPIHVVTKAMESLRSLTAVPYGGYANLGSVENTVGWAPDTSVDGATYASAVGDWIVRGARIVGGCCGTGPRHIRAARQLIDRWQTVQRTGPGDERPS